MTRISWEADRQTHELLVEVTPERLERRIAIGQRADVRIEVGRQEHALRIPIRMVHHDGTGAFVYADRGGKIARVRPKFGLTGSEHVEILDGLAEEGRLVVKDGVPLADLAYLRRRHLGFVSQKANLTSFLTARENVEIACEFGGKRDGRRRARELLEYLDVAGRERSYPEMLSGGEQQRVAIARALANEPSLILADEPTAALDSVRSRSVMELFRRVAHERGAAVLVVTHDHRALEVFDVLYEMEDGRIRPYRHERPAPSVAP